MTKGNIINNYYKYLIDEKKLASNTVSSYMLDINKIAEFIGSNDIINFTTDNKLVSRYIITLRNDSYSESTISRVVSTINSFNMFLYTNNIINSKIKIDISFKQPANTKELVIFTRDEINAILDFKDNSFLDLRDKAIFELVYAIGIKPTDCINLLKSDINLDIGYLKYVGAKGVYHTVPLNSETITALKNYVKLCDHAKVDNLFVSSSGEALTRQGFWKIFKKRQKVLMLDKELNPTTYRNSLAVHLLEDGVAIEDVKELLGLKTITSLKQYFELLNKEKRMSKLLLNHPRNSIK